MRGRFRERATAADRAGENRNSSVPYDARKICSNQPASHSCGRSGCNETSNRCIQCCLISLPSGQFVITAAQLRGITLLWRRWNMGIAGCLLGSHKHKYEWVYLKRDNARAHASKNRQIKVKKKKTSKKRANTFCTYSM